MKLPKCRYCQEPSVYPRPRHDPTEDVYIVRVPYLDGNGHDPNFAVIVFCSPECRESWVDAFGDYLYDTKTLVFDDEVPVDILTD